MPVINNFDHVDTEWLTKVLGETVVNFELSTSTSNWAQNAQIAATIADGSTRSLWLKLCIGDTFGKSEVDYYTRDYFGLQAAPLVKCYDACFEPGRGYHLLLEDMSGKYRDRKTAPPTLEHGFAIAAALARMHRHHWEAGVPPSSVDWERYFAQIRPGVTAIESATNRSFSDSFEIHAKKLVQRWSDPKGLTLLHGDVNPTNVLTPLEAEFPVYFLDRQPFDWSIQYGLAVYDLAYALVPWWPHAFRTANRQAILEHWFDHLDQPDYSWEQATYDWDLSVEHCLHIPIEWCREPCDVVAKRELWAWQLGNITGLSVGL